MKKEKEEIKNEKKENISVQIPTTSWQLLIFVYGYVFVTFLIICITFQWT